MKRTSDLRLHWQRNLCLCAFSVLVAVQLVGCGSATTTVSNPFNGSAVQPGTTVTIGSTWHATLASVSTNAGQDTSFPNGGDVYIIAHMQFKNITNKAQTLYTVTPLVLRDSTDQLYTQITLPYITTPDGTVNAGATKTGDVAFEVPLVQHQFQLAYDGTDGHALWSFSL